MDVDSFLMSLKWFILLAGAVTTGLFIRTMGQWAIDWAKEPYDNQKRDKERVSALKDIRSCLSQASLHIGLLDRFLNGKGAEGETQATITIPSFNLDIALLEYHAPHMRKIVAEPTVDLLGLIRFELTHLRRRIDTLEGLHSIMDEGNPRITLHAYGTRTLNESTSKIVTEAIDALDKEISQIQTDHKRNTRPLLVAASFLFFALILAWVGAWNNSTRNDLEEQRSPAKALSSSRE
jgi:hypothetical protein